MSLTGALSRAPLAPGLWGLDGGAFTPASLTGLKLQAASDLGTFQDTARTTPAAVTDDPVGGWTDQSGQGNHPIQATAGSRGLWKPNIFGTKPGILLDGTDDHLTANGIAALLTGNSKAFTVIMAVKLADTSADHALFALGSSGNNNPFHRLQASTSGPTWNSQRREDGGGGDGVVPGGGTPTTAAAVVSTVYTGAGATVSVHVNGTAVINAAAQVAVTLTVDRFGIGALVRAAASSLFKGHLGYILVWDRALAAADRSAAERFVGTWGGITVA